MHFKKVILPASAVAELYKHSLVILDKEVIFDKADKENDATNASKNVVNKIHFLGGFKKKIAILIEEHFHPHISDNDLNFIVNVLNACQLTLEDVAIVNIISNQCIKQLFEIMPVDILLLFGVHTSLLGISLNLQDFEIDSFNNCRILKLPAIEKFQGNNQEIKLFKRQLWDKLQYIFSI